MLRGSLHSPALTRREEGLMKHGGMLTSHPSRYLPGLTEAGLDFWPRGFVVSGREAGLEKYLSVMV